MLEAKPNKEILKIKTSMLGFTPGQVACVTVGLIAGSITYFVLPVPDFCKIPVIAVVVVFHLQLWICNNGWNERRTDHTGHVFNVADEQTAACT